MKSIRTNPTNHAPEGDERIRTAVCERGTDPTYVIFTAWWDEEPGKKREVTGWCKTCAGYDGRPDDVYFRFLAGRRW